MLERINIRKYLKEYGSQIESVSCGGESGPEARLRKGNRVYEIPREHQHSQAHKAHLDFDGTRLPAWDEPDMEED